MASVRTVDESTGPLSGSVGRVVVAFGARLVLTAAVFTAALLMAAAAPAAGLGPDRSGDIAVDRSVDAVGDEPADGASAAPTLPVAARDFGIPLALLGGIGIFLVLSSQAGSQASKLAEAPLRPGGRLRFPAVTR
jgi:hypothetical protein